MSVALPGDIVQLPASSSSAAIRLGPGLVYPSEASKAALPLSILATHAGIVGKVDEKGKGKERQQKQEGWWLEHDSRRYIPSAGDPVIAQVTAKNAEFYTVSLLRSSHPATLSVLAFEGATKRHRPNLKVGALVYGVVLNGSEGGVEPEITCVDAATGKGNGMGELDAKEGYNGTVDVSLAVARSLLRASHPLLPSLADHFPFESAVGANGTVWLRVTDFAHLIAARLVLQSSGDISLTDTAENTILPGPVESRDGESGRKQSSQWGAHMDQAAVKKIVQRVLNT